MPLAFSITRRQALQLRAVMRRAFGNRGPGPALGFIADAEGLRVKARFADAAVEYRAPGEHPAETLWLPFPFLADCEGKKDEPVELAAADKGRVTAQWRDGSVPQIVSYECEPPADATARCTLSATDAAFLAQSLPRLPSDDAYNFPVTLDLNGYIAIRAKAVDQAKPTEIVLTNSSWSGEPVRLNLNRKFLARALKLGFHDLLVDGDKVPVVYHDEHRHFVWATLEPESAIPPAEDAIRIESPSAEPQTPATQPQTRRRIGDGVWLNLSRSTLTTRGFCRSRVTRSCRLDWSEKTRARQGGGLSLGRCRKHLVLEGAAPHP
jgi:hypothetical protein